MSIIDQILGRPVSKPSVITAINEPKKVTNNILDKVKPLDLSAIKKSCGTKLKVGPPTNNNLKVEETNCVTPPIQKCKELTLEEKKEQSKHLISLNRNFYELLDNPQKAEELEKLKRLTSLAKNEVDGKKLTTPTNNSATKSTLKHSTTPNLKHVKVMDKSGRNCVSDSKQKPVKPIINEKNNIAKKNVRKNVSSCNLNNKVQSFKKPNFSASPTKNIHPLVKTTPKLDRKYSCTSDRLEVKNKKRSIFCDDLYQATQEDLDFIDDADDDTDWRLELRATTGYNPHKYADLDDDCADMEVSAATCLKEDLRSAQIGKKEDAEEEKRELQHQLEKKRKLNLSKKKISLEF